MDANEKLFIPTEEAQGRTIIGALVDALYALREIVDASESVHVYPEGAVGLEELTEAESKGRIVLERFNFDEVAATQEP